MENTYSDRPRLSRADAKRMRLRSGLSGDTPVVAVGAHDAMSAVLIGNYNFDAVWVSGFGVSAMAYGQPDLNLVTMSETLAVTRSIESVDRPAGGRRLRQRLRRLQQRRPHGR